MSGISSRAGEAKRALTLKSHDLAAMTLALALGKRGLGQCWPNPSVGVVIADSRTGQIISCGWTGRGGRPHGEAIALAAAGEAARGATLYATLEPCSHWGKTPPCADALIASGIQRLVYGGVDPDPRVSGQGLARLRAHGVEVIEGPLPREARWLALGHELRVTAKRPFVQLKLALDADGMIPAGNGAPVWATGEDARAYGHLLRAQADVIIVGSGTVAADDPELTCRLPGLADHSPVRVVLARDAALPRNAKLFRQAAQFPLWVIGCADPPPKNKAELDRAGATYIAVQAGPGGYPDVGAALHALAERGITRVLLEGGPKVAAAFLAADVIDEAVIFAGTGRSPGERIAPFGPAGMRKLIARDGVQLVSTGTIGPDRVSVYRRREFW